MKRIVLFGLSAAMIGLIFSSYTTGPFQGGAGNHTGSASSPANCSTGSGCHATNNAGLGITVQMLDNGTPVTKYTAGKTYRILLGATITGSFPRFGFQATAVKDANSTTQAGTFATGGRSGIATRSSVPQIIEHSTPISGTILAGQTVDSVSFLWTAPVAGTGKIRFFVAMNAVNFNGSESGDAPNATSAAFDENAGVGIASVRKDRMTAYPNPALDNLHLKLQGGSESCSIRVWDMAGRALMTQVIRLVNGEASLNIANLKPGNYYVLLQQGAQQYSASFLKQ